jgi:hypothetical protein
MHIEDMPKLLSVFKREYINGAYVVTPEIDPDCAWVFTDPSVLAVEKLDGTNVSAVMNNGTLVGLYNRTTPIEFSTLHTNQYIEGIRHCPNLGHALANNGHHFGELMGPKIQKNFLKLEENVWFPFSYLREKFAYKSFHKYPKTFENISSWFQNDLFSLVYQKYHGEKIQPEGIVFHHPDGRMAKLRRDMFDWYTGHRHGGYAPQGVKQ